MRAAIALGVVGASAYWYFRKGGQQAPPGLHVLVLGGSTGYGAALVQEHLRRGDSVIAASRSAKIPSHVVDVTDGLFFAFLSFCYR